MDNEGIDATLEEICDVTLHFCMQEFKVGLEQLNEAGDGWKQIVLLSVNPMFPIKIVILEFQNSFSVSVIVNERQFLTSDEPEDVFELLLEAHAIINGDVE